MGIKTVEATGPVAKPYTVDQSAVKSNHARDNQILTHDKIGYTCSESPYFFQT